MIESGKNNRAVVWGKVDGMVAYSHIIEGMEFFKATIRVERLSDRVDNIPVVVKKDLVDSLLEAAIQGKEVKITGSLRTRNVNEEESSDGKRHLLVYLYANTLEVFDEKPEEVINTNIIYVKGTICKPPILKKTPLGKQITDLCIAVDRNYRQHHSDYLPCIAWGSGAVRASKMQVGDKIAFEGRIQSREYVKKLPEKGILETRVAYEVSVMSMW